MGMLLSSLAPWYHVEHDRAAAGCTPPHLRHRITPAGGVGRRILAGWPRQRATGCAHPLWAGGAALAWSGVAVLGYAFGEVLGVAISLLLAFVGGAFTLFTGR
ncbi:MAG TPA: hypothetical protein VGR57_11010 [Ktedonobacterales bacterium]|nr:hypothetical protein [Ktedonobacterales bacterium]